ncbi:RHS repeat domain-containing protein [Tenacibaculum sp. FZY0031]|uniref:RHS repeat domain-containing protein n=1 Tax=Tenacibaculum sp. FZY0031 TaxID=3116648 RepID=UPI002EC10B99|nr:RHS repeat domain-containing protein [Tenacibaculum sp. FZY0031]
MKKTMLSIVMMLFCVWGYAQDLPTIIPPSPEASSLAKFTEVPISHYTGLPNINIPITSFQVDGKEFPIRINYHARGIKVEEISSRIGIGWALSAGGQISRQVRHIPDDGGLNQIGMLSTGNMLSSSLANNAFFNNEETRTNYEVTLTALVQHDREPDKFMLQAGDLSTNFIIDYHSKKPLNQKFDDIKTEVLIGDSDSPNVTNKIIGFITKDKDGFTYYFGTSKDQQRNARDYDQVIKTYSINKNGYDEQAHPVSPTFNTWHLMDIEGPNGDITSFHYSLEDTNYLRRSYDGHSLGERVSFASEIRNYQFQLDSIIHNRGKIEFIKSVNEREDLKLGHSLERINIKDIKDTFIKAFNFYQSFESTQANTTDYTNYTLKNLDISASKKMFLDSVVTVGKNNKVMPATIFSYYNKILPNRFSNAQDYWGYYNKATNGQYLSLLNYYYYINPQGFLEKYPYTNATVDRTVDTIASMSGILTKIKYPTGGSAKFTYEHNKGIIGSEMNVIDLPDINPKTPTLSKGISFLEQELYDGDKYVSESFLVGEVNGKVRFNVSLPNNYNGTGEVTDQNLACANPIQSDCRFNITLKGLNGAPSYHYIFAGVTEFEVEPGQYQIIFDPLDSSWSPLPPAEGELPTNIFSASMSWVEIVNDNNTLFAAGKRIKKIEHYDANQNLSSFKEYEYTYPDGTNSGVILSLSAFSSIRRLNTYTSDGSQLQAITVLEPHGSIPGSPLTTYQGNSIGYSSVKEYFGDKNNNVGKIEYSFTNFKDSGLDLSYDDYESSESYMTFPYHLPNDFEWLRGLPQVTNYYKKNNNGSFTKIKSTSNTYKYGNQNLSQGYPTIFAPRTKRLDISENMQDTDKTYYKDNYLYRLPLVHLYIAQDETPQGWDNEHTEYKTFHLTGGIVDLVSKTETNFLYPENLATTTYYYYNHNKHHQLASTETINSKGEVLKTKNYYTPDVTSVNSLGHDDLTPTEKAAIDQLKLQNRIAVPIQVETFKDNLLYSTQRTNYNNFNGFYLPEIIQTAKDSQSLEDRIIYHTYNDKGNPREVSKKDGTKIYYLWGYQQTQPIAKIENYTDTELANIQSLIDAAVSASNNDTDTASENNLRTALNNIRNNANMVNSQVTTFTYDPLVGVTSITDPRGQTISYEYDDFNRLKFIKDADGNLLKEHKYHYKN